MSRCADIAIITKAQFGTARTCNVVRPLHAAVLIHGGCCALQVRDREGAQQDLTSHCLAYKRRELAAMLGGSSFFGASSSSSHQPSEQQQQPDQVQPVQQPQQAQQLEPAQQPLQQERHAFGMLLFSCNGRGTSLYNEPSWDSRTLAGYIPVPVSGFMCNGEFLPGHLAVGEICMWVQLSCATIVHLSCKALQRSASKLPYASTIAAVQEHARRAKIHISGTQILHARDHHQDSTPVARTLP